MSKRKHTQISVYDKLVKLQKSYNKPLLFDGNIAQFLLKEQNLIIQRYTDSLAAVAQDQCNGISPQRSAHTKKTNIMKLNSLISGHKDTLSKMSLHDVRPLIDPSATARRYFTRFRKLVAGVGIPACYCVSFYAAYTKFATNTISPVTVLIPLFISALFASVATTVLTIIVYTIATLITQGMASCDLRREHKKKTDRAQLQKLFNKANNSVTTEQINKNTQTNSSTSI